MNETKWSQLGLQQALCEKLQANGIVDPTDVQTEAIPALLAGRDVTARSQTGTGKTLAYLLPILQRIDASSPKMQAIVLAPTQELGMQIVRVAESYAEPMGIKVQQLIGGAALKRQVEKLRLHPQLVIGTPGRIHELMKMRKIKLHDIKIAVVDETDQVFQLGSVREVEMLLKAMTGGRQLAFFSATHPQQMIDLESRLMTDPLRIEVKPEHRVSETIEHFYIVSDKRDKTDAARRILRMLEPKQALLFMNDTDNISNWQAKLGYEGFTVEALFGDADKQRRAATLNRFRDGQCQLLLATDVAARGLDIEGLPLVINLDPPLDADHYVHRAGRTGRMGRKGTVVSIVTPQEIFIMDKFRKTLGIHLPHKSLYKGELVAPSEVPSKKSFAARPGGDKRSEATKPVHDPYYPKKTSPAEGADASSSAAVQELMKPRKGKPAAVSGATKPKQPSAAAAKAQKKRDSKNKGAPKWLKAKHAQEPSDTH
ncbi:DEAD/DEAH box helicase [Paenibacillus sp. GCM10023252]|uniref:DEAD/DEAH box helicase n=1 Tax=Paenibacillus sp. GCM10023252 TaxID=3252649 RepID=UPI0036218322